MHQLANRFDSNISPLRNGCALRWLLTTSGTGTCSTRVAWPAKKGWNPDQWFGHVEQAMRLLAKPAYYKRARYGFCRCGQPVHYVGNIQEMYDAYVGMLTIARRASQTQI